MALHKRCASQPDWLYDLLGLALLLIFFYTAWLGSYPFFTPDEGRYAEVAREMVVNNDFITPRVNGVVFLDKPILYYWLEALSIALFGVKEWAVRLFPALLGIIGCLATYVSGRLLFDRRTGILSALILATTPLYFIGAHYANLDLEVAVFISMSLLFFITGMQHESTIRTRFLLAAYLCASLACLTKGLIGIVFPALIGGLWILLLRRFHLILRMHLITGIFLFCLIVLPWYALVQKENPEFLHYFFVTQHFTRFLSAAQFNNPSPIWFYIPIILIGFFPWTLFIFSALKEASCRIIKARETHTTELFLLLWVAVIFIFFSIPRSKIITYILPIFPALALLTGHYLSHIWQALEAPKVKRFGIALIILTIILAALLFTVPYFFSGIETGFSPYRYTMISILIASAIASYFIVLRQPRISLLFVVSALTSMLLLLTLTMGAGHLNQQSAKSLVHHLKKVRQAQEEIIMYFKYYYDVPLYLGQTVTIAGNWQAADIAERDNWVRELWNGMAFKNTHASLISEETFWQRFNDGNRIFVFLNANYFDQFKQKANHYFILGKENDIILLSNQPTVVTSP